MQQGQQVQQELPFPGGSVVEGEVQHVQQVQQGLPFPGGSVVEGEVQHVQQVQQGLRFPGGSVAEGEAGLVVDAGTLVGGSRSTLVHGLLVDMQINNAKSFRD